MLEDCSEVVYLQQTHDNRYETVGSAQTEYDVQRDSGVLSVLQNSYGYADFLAQNSISSAYKK